jgi:hypothetical protein
LATETEVCLDPSPDVCRVAGIIEFNKNKFFRRSRKRPRFGGDIKKVEEQETNKESEQEKLLKLTLSPLSTDTIRPRSVYIHMSYMY